MQEAAPGAASHALEDEARPAAARTIERAAVAERPPITE